MAERMLTTFVDDHGLCFEVVTLHARDRDQFNGLAFVDVLRVVADRNPMPTIRIVPTWRELVQRVEAWLRDRYEATFLADEDDTP